MNYLKPTLFNLRRSGRWGLLLSSGLLILVLSGCVDPATGAPIPPLFSVPAAEPIQSNQPQPAAASPVVVPAADGRAAVVRESEAVSDAITDTAAITITNVVTDDVTDVVTDDVADDVADDVSGEPEATAVPAPESAPAPVAEGGPPTAVIETNRGNVRGGPGTNNPVVAVAEKGDTFTVIARNEAGTWLQVCCIEGDRRAWIAESIVAVTGDLDTLPIAKALFPEDFAATWQVDYTCDSDRCAVAACSGTMSAVGRQFVRSTFLEIDRRVEWADGCGDDSYWLHQVDNFSGQERYVLAPDSPLFRYWIGALPGPANDAVTLADGRTVDVLCAGPFTQENDEGSGWISVYTGDTCHDVRTGMIVTMQYDKQWFFTGEFEGQTYSRQFFGDQESYNLTLTETNAELAEQK